MVSNGTRRGYLILALIDVMSTLLRTERAGELDTGTMDPSLDATKEDFERFASMPLYRDVMDGARVRSRRYGLRGADTIHLAAACWIGNRPTFEDESIGLVTSDREVAEAADHAGLAVFDPTREPLPKP